MMHCYLATALAGTDAFNNIQNTYPMQDMLDAFPNEDRVNSSNMRQFATAVAGLLHISDFQRRRITHMMRHYRDMRRRSPHAACHTRLLPHLQLHRGPCI